MRFRYPLQKLVDLKTNEKEQAEWRLSEAIGLLREEERALSELDAERERTCGDLERASANKTTISRILLLQSYLQHIEQQLRLKMQDIARAERNVADKQQQLNAKIMEEKVWSKAKEKALIQFTALQLKKEQEELDEIALTRRIQTI